MSNNLVYERVHDNMLSLGLTTAEGIVDNWLSTASKRDISTMEVLDHLFEQEVSKRRISAIETRTRLSGIPVKKSIQDFDLNFQKSNEKR